MLTKVKDPLSKEKQAGAVYQCGKGKVYVGETQRRLEICVKEHKDACNKEYTKVCHRGASVGSTPSEVGRH